jgi:hypothetical protein
MWRDVGPTKGSLVKSEPLQAGDLELVEAAKAVIGSRFRLDWHHVGCAVADI